MLVFESYRDLTSSIRRFILLLLTWFRGVEFVDFFVVGDINSYERLVFIGSFQSFLVIPSILGGILKDA